MQKFVVLNISFLDRNIENAFNLLIELLSSKLIKKNRS